uniref:EGF-like domain-containing protein n=1 Tax=Acrobeloides nanus TaxID=290746 RepID=A0A914C789_9BILA
MLEPPLKDEIICDNDGFYLGNGSCHCNLYTSDQICSTWDCLNYGFNSDKRPSCECPLGFVGPHCEPTTCISNEQGLISVFNDDSNSVTFLLIYNDGIKNMFTSDNITGGIINALAQSPNLNRAVLYGAQTLPGNGDHILCNKIIDGALDTCISNGIAGWNDVYECNSPDCYFLIPSFITEALLYTSINSPLIIITNGPLAEYQDSDITYIISIAIARRIQITVIVATYKTETEDAFQNKGFLALKNISDKTLGFFLSPYEPPPFSNLYTGADKIQTIIPAILPILLDKIDVSVGVVNDGCNFEVNSSFHCGFNSPCPSNSYGYIALFSYTPNPPINDAKPPNFKVNLPSNTVSKINSRSLQIFSFDLPSNNNRPTTFNVTADPAIKSCSYHIFTGLISTKTYIGYIQDTGVDVSSFQDKQADITSALPLSNVPNTIVAHTKYIGNDQELSSLQLDCINYDLSVDFKPLYPNSSHSKRLCFFDSVYAELNCTLVGSYGLLHIKATTWPYEELIPFICIDDSNSIFTVSGTRFKKSTKIQQQSQLLDDANNTCSNIGIQPALDWPKQEETKVQRSFYLALTNSGPIINQLFNQPPDQQFIVTLQEYIKSYDDEFFNKYHLLKFLNGQFNYTIWDDYENFRTSLMTDLNFNQSIASISNTSTTLSDLLCQMLCRPGCNSMLGGLEQLLLPDSEIFVISDVELSDNVPLCASKAIEYYKLRLSFLYLNNFPDDQIKNGSDLSQITKGFPIVFSNISDISTFFKFYQKKADSELVLSDFNDASWKSMRSMPFNYLSNRQYFAMVRTNIFITPETYVNITDINGNISYRTLMPSQTIEPSLAIYELPHDIPNGTYCLVFNNIPLYKYFYYMKLFEVTPPNRYYFAFAKNYKATQNDAYMTYPIYNDINLNPVVKTVNNSAATYTLYQSINGSIVPIYQGALIPRDPQSCIYNQYSNFSWYCNEPNALYYLKVDDGSTDTRTELVTCYSDKNDTNNVCFNGYIDNNKCVCNCGYTGDKCDTIICQNGGTPTNRDQACLCKNGFSGVFCEISSWPCINQPQYPTYNTEVRTLVFIINNIDEIVNNLPDIRELGTNNGNEFFSNTVKKFILATYSCVNQVMVYDVQSFTDIVKFKTAITMVKSNGSAPCSQANAQEVIKSTLQLAQPRALVIVAGGATQCNNNFDSEFANLIAKTKAEIRIFQPSDQSSQKCFQQIASLANGLALTPLATNFKKLYQYVNAIIPPDDSLRLTVLDVGYFTNTSSFTRTLNVEYPISLVISLINLKIESQTSVTLIDDNVYVLNLTSPTTLNFTSLFSNNCGFLIEALTAFQMSYGVTPLSVSSTPLYATNNYFVSNFISYIKDYDKGQSSDHPTFQLSQIDFSTGVHEYFPTNKCPTKTTCTYPFSVEFQCPDAFIGIIKTKVALTLTDAFGPIYNGQEVVNTYCLTNITCIHGNNLNEGACLCENGWTGFDCSYPVCLNNGKFVTYASRGGSSCKCEPPYYGPRCENNANQTLPLKRNILFLLDTYDQELFDRRIAIINKTLSLYDNSNAQFAIASNTGSKTFAPIGLDNKEKILASLPKSAFPNSSVELDSAFQFFDNLTLNSNSSQYISGIFFLTQTSYPIDFDQTHYLNLMGKNVIFLSGIPGDDTNTTSESYALELNLIGGVIESVSDDDIINQYVIAMKGSDLTTSTTTTITPPITTTIARDCVYYKKIDVEFIIDVTLNASIYKNITLNFGALFGSGFLLANDSSRILVRRIADTKDWSSAVTEQTFCNYENITFWKNIANFGYYRFTELYLNTSLIESSKDFTNPTACADPSKPQYIIYLTAHDSVADAATAPLLKNSTISSTVKIIALTFAIHLIYCL